MDIACKTNIYASLFQSTWVRDPTLWRHSYEGTQSACDTDVHFLWDNKIYIETENMSACGNNVYSILRLI